MRRRVLAIAAIGVLFATGCGSSGTAGGSASDTAASAPTTTVVESPATTAPPPGTAWHHRVATGATTTGSVPVFARPGDTTPQRTLPHPRRINDDPKATVPLVMNVLEEDGDWVKVSLPVRPNGSTGWVRASDVEITGHDFHVEIRLSGFELKVFHGTDVVVDAPIGVAADNTPTPGGTYYITELIAPRDPNGAYGPYAYGLSGYSDVLTTFNGGSGQLGIHGTNEPQKIGTKVSHGCIRLRNEDIKKVVAAGLPLGTPVTIDP